MIYEKILREKLEKFEENVKPGDPKCSNDSNGSHIWIIGKFQEEANYSSGNKRCVLGRKNVKLGEPKW